VHGATEQILGVAGRLDQKMHVGREAPDPGGERRVGLRRGEEACLVHAADMTRRTGTVIVASLTARIPTRR
jgi:hypothetical protein